MHPRVSSAHGGGQYVAALVVDLVGGPLLPQQQYSDGGELGEDWQWSDLSGGDDQIQCVQMASWMVPMWLLVAKAEMMMLLTIVTLVQQQQQQQLGGELQQCGGVLEMIGSSGNASGGDEGGGGAPRSRTFLGLAYPFD